MTYLRKETEWRHKCVQCASRVSVRQTVRTSHTAAPSFRGAIRRKLLWNDEDRDHDDHDHSVARTTLSAGQEMGRTRHDTTLTTHYPLYVSPSNGTKLQM